MNATSIEWTKNPDGSQGYTWNVITGCLNHVNGLCKGGGFPCYAYKLANTRLKQRYLANNNGAPGCLDILDYGQAMKDPFYPRFWEEKLNDGIFSLGRKAKGIFVCDMGDLFGIGVPEDWTRQILAVCRMSCYQQHRFYLLTKQPQNLIKFSPFPENCWVGVTATGYKAFNNALDKLKCIEAKVKYISIEPLLEPIPFNMERLAYCGINWLIIGACTGTKAEMTELVRKYPELTLMSSCTDVDRRNRYITRWTAQPRIEWVREIVEAADRAGIPVFLKDNLRPLLIPEDCSKPNYLHEDIFWASEKAQLRQEMPELQG